MPAEHKLLKFILPANFFEAIRRDTKKWLLECPCGHKSDFWDADGVRYKGAGEPRQYYKCTKCGRGTWHKIRKKTDLERRQF